MLFCVAFTPPALYTRAAVPGPDKKLIEYGWDVPTPAQMRDELTAMEKRPFEGIIFKLSAGYNAFLARQKFTEGKPLGFDIEPLIEAVGKR